MCTLLMLDNVYLEIFNNELISLICPPRLMGLLSHLSECKKLITMNQNLLSLANFLLRNLY